MVIIIIGSSWPMYVDLKALRLFRLHPLQSGYGSTRGLNNCGGVGQSNLIIPEKPRRAISTAWLDFIIAMIPDATTSQPPKWHEMRHRFFSMSALRRR